jgi:hypothetical protein
MAWTGSAIVASALLYPLLQTARKRGWCRFVGSPHDFESAVLRALPLVVDAEV